MLLADEGKYRLLYQTAVEESRLAVWEYDIEKKTASPVKNSYTENYYKELPLPSLIQNVPHALEKYFEDSSVAD